MRKKVASVVFDRVRVTVENGKTGFLNRILIRFSWLPTLAQNVDKGIYESTNYWLHVQQVSRAPTLLGTPEAATSSLEKHHRPPWLCLRPAKTAVGKDGTCGMSSYMVNAGLLNTVLLSSRATAHFASVVGNIT